MIKQLKTSTLLFLSLLYACSSAGTSTNCVGASNPINVALNNNGKEAQVVTLFSHSEAKGFIKIAQFEFEPYEKKDICLDKEGALKNGLFIFNGIDAYGLSLASKGRIEINLTGNKYQITSPEQLRDLINAM